MKERDLKVLGDIFVSNVLLLAKQLKAEKKSFSSSDFIDDALKLIDRNRAKILETR